METLNFKNTLKNVLFFQSKGILLIYQKKQTTMSYIFTLTNGKKINVTNYTDIKSGYLVNNQKLSFSDVKFIDPDFEGNTNDTAVEKKQLKNKYYYTVETGRKNSDSITVRQVTVVAKSAADADDIIDKRFPKAYDVQRLNGWDDFDS